jgi:HEAT repeat protein
MSHPVLVDVTDLQPSSVILGTLASLAVLAGLLYWVGVLGAILNFVGGLLRGGIYGGFRLWSALLSWAPYPVFLGLVLGMLALGIHLTDDNPEAAAVVASVPLAMGICACLAYMFIDWERYDVARGYKSVHNPLKGQELAHYLIRHGHRVGVPLLGSAAVAVVGGFALLNQALCASVGRTWYSLGDLDGTFADFLAFSLVQLYNVVDLLDIAASRRLLELTHIRAIAWPAVTMVALFKGFFTLVLLQQVFASVRESKLLGETIEDFWSPHEPIHLRAVSTLPVHGLNAIVPLLASLRSREVLTREQREQLPRLLAEIGPAITPLLLTHLRDPNPDVRAVAVAALGRLRATDALPRLLRLADDPNDAVRLHVVEALGAIGEAGTPPVATRELSATWRRRRPRFWMRVWWWWQRRRRIDPIPAVVAALRVKLADIGPAVRVQTAQALASVGPRARAAAPELMMILQDADESVRCEAAAALGRIGEAGPEALAALTALLRDGSAALRMAAARALGQLQKAAAPAAPALASALRDPDEAVQKVAAEAIARIGTMPEEAMDTLVGGLSNPDNLVRLSTARALGAIGTVAAKAAPALVKALADSNDAVRAEAVEALGKLGPAAAEAAVPRIVRALRDPDSWVSALAAEALGQMGESAEEAVPALIRALRHVNARVRANAAEALGKLGSAAAAARTALLGTCGDDDGGVRSQAVRALGALGPEPAAVPAVRQAFHDADPHVRAAAVEAVGLWSEADEALRGDIIELLDDPNDEVKAQAAQVLPRLPGLAAPLIERLSRRLLHDDCVWIQGQAALALGRLGAEARPAGPALQQAALTAEASVREQALQALALIQPPEAAAAFLAGMKDANADIRTIASAGWRKAAEIPDEAIASLIEALRDPEVAVRSNAACALGRLDTLPAEAIPLLLECAEHPSEGLRWYTALALQTAPVKSVRGVLQRLLDDVNVSIRLLAARALLGGRQATEDAVAVVVDALASPLVGYRRAALKLIAAQRAEATAFAKALRERARLEEDEGLRDELQQMVAELDESTDGPPLIPEASAAKGAGETMAPPLTVGQGRRE